MDCFLRTNANIGYFNVYVLSETHAPDKLLQSVNTFLYEHFQEEILSKSFKTRFSAKKDYIKNKIISKKYVNHIDVDSVWFNIMSGNPHFKLYRNQYKVLKFITLKRFQEFYYRLILDQNLRKKLIVVVYGHGKKTVLNVDCNIKLDNVPPTLDLASACE